MVGMRKTLPVLALLLLLPGLAGGAKAARPWIGIAVERGDKGVRVTEALAGTPAARAGLRAGDVVLAIDGTAVSLPDELIWRVQERGVGQKVVLTVHRDGKRLQVELALEARPGELELVRDRLVGKRAPDFSLAGIAGPTPTRLAGLAGQVVLVDFWATWCGACRESLPRLLEWQRAYGPRGLRLVGVSSEKPEVLRKFASGRELPFTVAVDPDDKVGATYHVPAIPMLVVIDRAGVVRFVHIGGGAHLDEVEAAIRPLLAP